MNPENEPHKKRISREDFEKSYYPPDRWTDEEIDSWGFVICTKLIAGGFQALAAVTQNISIAADSQDRDALSNLRSLFKDGECRFSALKERLEKREQSGTTETVPWLPDARAKASDLEEAYRNAGDDISRALNSELPGQTEEGEEWKNG
jgi:hypothetical protein